MSPDHSGLRPKAKGLRPNMLRPWVWVLGAGVIVLLNGAFGPWALACALLVLCYHVSYRDKSRQ